LKLQFLGATGTVTGSKYLIEHNGTRVLIDCGLFQGFKELRERNWEKLPVDASTLKAVILTHAHIDHSGYLPLLIKQGFTGKIYCSQATMDLCAILLPDSGHLHEEDARRANKYGYSQHQPAMPLYTREDAVRAMDYFKPIEFGQPFYLDDELHFTLSRSGHILGSSFISMSDRDHTIVFSGDLGRMNDPIMQNPAKLQYADYLVLESTYGDRLHDRIDPAEQIGAVIRETAARGGTVVIPAFAVGRAQSVLYYIHQLKQQGKIPDLPVFLDSPMAINATNLMCKFNNEHKLSPDVCRDVCDTAQYVSTVEESKRIDQLAIPSVIISASGMATGGRVLHHLKYFMTDAKNTILFTGFQASGTRGDAMVRGTMMIHIHGEEFPCRAKVINLSSLSAHSDYEETLSWLKNFQRPPQKVFLTHGEPESAAALKEKIESYFGWNVVIPEYLQTEEF
jgi:metallo-beta-lactamase family protein